MIGRFVVFMSSIFLFCAVAQSQDGVAERFMKFDKISIDLGTVSRDTLIKMVYEFENIGTKALEVDMVSTCVCSEALWPWKPVEAGEKGTIKVTFDTSKKEKEEPITLDVNFVNIDPKSGYPIFKTLEYTFSFRD